LDTTGYSTFHSRLVNAGVIREFSLELATKYQNTISSFSGVLEYKEKFNISEGDWQGLLSFGKTKDVEVDLTEAKAAKEAILLNVKALVARSEWNGQGYYPIINEGDKVIEAALQELN